MEEKEEKEIKEISIKKNKKNNTNNTKKNRDILKYNNDNNNDNNNDTLHFSYIDEKKTIITKLTNKIAYLTKIKNKRKKELMDNNINMEEIEKRIKYYDDNIKKNKMERDNLKYYYELI
jgi:Tfp pilus assembly protein FimT